MNEWRLPVPWVWVVTDLVHCDSPLGFAACTSKVHCVNGSESKITSFSPFVRLRNPWFLGVLYFTTYHTRSQFHSVSWSVWNMNELYYWETNRATNWTSQVVKCRGKRKHGRSRWDINKVEILLQGEATCLKDIESNILLQEKKGTHRCDFACELQQKNSIVLIMTTIRWKNSALKKNSCWGIYQSVSSSNTSSKWEEKSCTAVAVDSRIKHAFYILVISQGDFYPPGESNLRRSNRWDGNVRRSSSGRWTSWLRLHADCWRCVCDRSVWIYSMYTNLVEFSGWQFT